VQEVGESFSNANAANKSIILQKSCRFSPGSMEAAQ
jgi:hypothetical protein